MTFWSCVAPDLTLKHEELSNSAFYVVIFSMVGRFDYQHHMRNKLSIYMIRKSEL